MAHQELIVNGEVWTSVTEALSYPPKPWLEKWKVDWGILATRKTKAATDIGTAFHECIEAALNHLDRSPRVLKMYAEFNKWVSQSGLVINEQELHVTSKLYKYHGTFDAVGYFLSKPKSLCIFDWKTSSGIYPDMALQLSAYAQAYKEQTGIEIKRGIIVLVSKDKPHHKVTVKEYKLGKRLFNKFLKRLKDYNHYKKEAGI